ncbi:MAG TPA: hypothetical protein VMV81_00255 [Phycisphaerae bacterium]|nr:hypothetical protein [Phycisphaerae bacterium]
MIMKRAGITSCMLVAAMMAVGCGDNIVTAVQKITSGQICKLSANEIKALNQAAITVGANQTPPVTIPALTDDQAAALAKFAADNGLCTEADLENIQNRVDNGPPLVGLNDLAAAFGNIDPSNVDANELSMIFKQALGG